MSEFKLIYLPIHLIIEEKKNYKLILKHNILLFLSLYYVYQYNYLKKFHGIMTVKPMNVIDENSVKVMLKEMVTAALIEHLTPIRQEMDRNASILK